MAVDEIDITREQGWYYEVQCQKVISKLIKNHIEAQFAPDRGEALRRLTAAIPEGATIGIGDSVTVHQIGFYSWLEQHPGRTIFNPFLKDPQGHNIYNPQERFEVMRQAMTADVFLASSNAITQDGELVNIDATGNRVAAMIFGPRKVLLVIGANKIVDNLDEALKRVKEWCCPINLKRHITKHHYSFFAKAPCASGTCVDCDSPAKVCRKIVIIDGQLQMPEPHVSSESRIQVILVGESLGI